MNFQGKKENTRKKYYRVITNVFIEEVTDADLCGAGVTLGDVGATRDVLDNDVNIGVIRKRYCDLDELKKPTSIEGFARRVLVDMQRLVMVIKLREEGKSIE